MAAASFYLSFSTSKRYSEQQEKAPKIIVKKKQK
jgi:hypothetical protein